MKSFQYIRPINLGNALKHGTLEGSVHKAGGIDLLDLMKSYVVTPKRVIDLKSLPGLDGIEPTTEGVRIGALVTLARIAADGGIRAHYRALAEAAGEAATPQIRNVATLGGNLCQRPRCWYYRLEQIRCLKKGGDRCHALDGENKYHAIFDTEPCPIVHPSNAATALVALGAQMTIANVKEKRTWPLENFFLLPKDDLQRENHLMRGEVIENVFIPRWPAGTVSAYEEGREKESFDWALVSAAAVLQMEGKICRKASLVLGAVAPAPRRAREAEHFLEGKEITEEVAATAARKAFEGAKPLSQNGYKVPMGVAIAKRTILKAVGLW